MRAHWTLFETSYNKIAQSYFQTFVGPVNVVRESKWYVLFFFYYGDVNTLFCNLIVEAFINKHSK